MNAKPECPYCGATEGLRQIHDGGGWVEPEYTCEDCFSPRDDGPCFDDLPPFTDAEINRSQAMLAAIFGPEEAERLLNDIGA